MTIDKSGEWWKGTEFSDVVEYLHDLTADGEVGPARHVLLAGEPHEGLLRARAADHHVAGRHFEQAIAPIRARRDRHHSPTRLRDRVDRRLDRTGAVARPRRVGSELEHRMLDTAIQSQLKTYLERLQRPIELRASLDASPAAEEMRALLRDIDHWTLLSTCDHDGVVSGYRVLKGMVEGRRQGGGGVQPNPLTVTLSLLDGRDDTEMSRVVRKLAGVSSHHDSRHRAGAAAGQHPDDDRLFPIVRRAVRDDRRRAAAEYAKRAVFHV